MLSSFGDHLALAIPALKDKVSSMKEEHKRTRQGLENGSVSPVSFRTWMRIRKMEEQKDNRVRYFTIYHVYLFNVQGTILRYAQKEISSIPECTIDHML